MKKSIYFILTVFLVISCEKKAVDQEPGDNTPTQESTLIIVPDHFSSIAAAIDFADDGDTILIRDGVYSGNAHCDIRLKFKSLVINSENGPDRTVIDCAADSINNHFWIELSSAASGETIIEGLTIRNAYATQGSAISLISTSALIKNCLFINNHSLISGGAIRCKGSSPSIINCTFDGNGAMSGGTIFLISSSVPTIDYCIISNTSDGESIRCNDRTSVPVITCSNIYNNAGGDWVDRIESLGGSNGNLSIDPQYCGSVEKPYFLENNSPCLPENNSCGELIGALGEGCAG